MPNNKNLLSISIELGIYKRCRKILKRSALFFYIPVCERAHYENCMNDIQIFKNEAFGEVRVAGTSEEPLFCLADVCKVLELGNPSQVKQDFVVRSLLMRSSRTLLVDHKK